MFEYTIDGKQFRLIVESPTDMTLEIDWPAVEELEIGFNYEYKLEVQEGDEWKPAPLVPRDDDSPNGRKLDEWAAIHFNADDADDYSIVQDKEVLFVLMPADQQSFTFDLSRHTILEPNNTYRLSKSLMIPEGPDNAFEEYSFVFDYEG